MDHSAMGFSLFLILMFISHSKLGVLSHANSNQDVRYTNFIHNANNLPEKEEYDYIIIGGGTAGCPLAATLSSNFSVLLLERGNDPNKFPSVLKEEGILDVLTSKDDGQNPFQRFTSEDGVENLRGRILGGGSMINAGFYSRAHKEFFEAGGVEWDTKMVEEAYQWVEEASVFKPSLSAWQTAFKSALMESGVGPDNGFDLRHRVGTKIGGSIFDGRGNRHGAVELLNKAHPSNLKVVIQATVQRILFSGLSASGVLYSDSNGNLHRAFIREKGEIIVSAGAIGSPQLLLLSGIGPKSDLSSLKLPIVRHQPHVGQFMADNPRFSLVLVLPFPVPLTSAKVVGTLENNTYLESLSSALSFLVPLPFRLPPPFTTFANPSIAIIGGKFSKVDSVGSLRLNSSSDVKESPFVRFNYYSHPDDLAQCVRGVRKIGDLLTTQTMIEFKTRDLMGKKKLQFLGLPLPPEKMVDDAFVEEFCRRTVATFWHYHGGCLVGKVVDGKVVDGSTFSVSPGTNPMATVMMLGRYVGLKMLQERSSVN